MTDAGEVDAVVDEAEGMVEFRRGPTGDAAAAPGGFAGVPAPSADLPMLAQLQARIDKIAALQARMTAATRGVMLEPRYVRQLKGGGLGARLSGLAAGAGEAGMGVDAGMGGGPAGLEGLGELDAFGEAQGEELDEEEQLAAMQG